MTDEELQKIAEKIAMNTASKEETLVFMRQYNALLAELKEELKK